MICPLDARQTFLFYLRRMPTLKLHLANRLPALRQNIPGALLLPNIVRLMGPGRHVELPSPIHVVKLDTALTVLVAPVRESRDISRILLTMADVPLTPRSRHVSPVAPNPPGLPTLLIHSPSILGLPPTLVTVHKSRTNNEPGDPPPLTLRSLNNMVPLITLPTHGKHGNVEVPPLVKRRDLVNIPLDIRTLYLALVPCAMLWSPFPRAVTRTGAALHTC